MDSLDTTLDLFDPDITFDMNLNHPDLIEYGISEEYLRFRIEEYFLPKIKEYCKKSNIPFPTKLFYLSYLTLKPAYFRLHSIDKLPSRPF